MIRILYFQLILNRVTFILLLLFVTCRPSLAQEPGSPLPLRQILSQIEQHLAVSFTYADETIAGIYLEPPADTLTLGPVLAYLRSNTPLNYSQLDERFITISPGTDTPTSICGYLVDALDKSPVIGATIQVSNMYTVSDDMGYFNLANVYQAQQVTIHMLGYKNFEFKAKSTVADQPCQPLELQPDVTQLKEVMVRNYIATGINQQLNGSFVLNRAKLGLLPGLTEPDILQTLQALPGIQSINETVSNINVRGGTNDQNLVLWDGIKMYQTGHFFGLISAFNPYLTDDVVLIKNGTTAALNDGVSSIIEINSENKLTKNFTGGAGMNMINADIFLKIPVTKKLSLQLSGRRSIADWLATPVFNNYFERTFGDTEVIQLLSTASDTTFNSNENFYFYDIAADLLYDISPKDKLRIHFLNINNELDYQENLVSASDTASRNSSLTQKSLAGSVHYQRLWNDKLRTSAQLYVSSYDLQAVNFDIANNQQLIQENEVLDTGIKLDALWRINNSWDLNSGYQFQEIGIGNLEEINNPQFRRYIKRVIRTHVVFSEANFLSVDKRSNIRFGVRVNYHPKFDRFLVEPRLAFNQKLSDYWSVEVLDEFKSQTATQIIDLQNDFLGVEKRRWVLADEMDIPIVQSKQASVGINFNKNQLLLGLAGFYKNVTGITSLSQAFQNQYQYTRTTGEYNIIGVEVLLNKQFDKASIWGVILSMKTYTISKRLIRPFFLTT